MGWYGTMAGPMAGPMNGPMLAEYLTENQDCLAVILFRSMYYYTTVNTRMESSKFI